MAHEIREYDIPDRQLLTTNSQSNAGRWTNIGEAKITHTIFGKAKVRIIREQDKVRRAWMLAGLVLVMAAMATAAWQGWITSNQAESAQSTDPQFPLNAKGQGVAADSQPEYTPPVTQQSVVGKVKAASQTGINNPLSGLKGVTQQALGLKASEHIASNSVATQSLTESKPKKSPLASGTNSSVNQADMQQPSKLSDPGQPANTTSTTPSARKPAASKPAAVAPLAAPLLKEITPNQLPAGDN